MTRKTMFVLVLAVLVAVPVFAAGNFDYAGVVESKSTVETSAGTSVHVTLTDKRGSLTIRCSGVAAQLACLKSEVGDKATVSGSIAGSEHVATDFQVVMPAPPSE